ncbi:MAG: helicase-related protein [Hymenobacter sp.]
MASIGARSLYLRNLMPEARIGVAHGRMNEEELEEIMLGFEEGAFDVLVSTTIVETGPGHSRSQHHPDRARPTDWGWRSSTSCAGGSGRRSTDCLCLPVLSRRA